MHAIEMLQTKIQEVLDEMQLPWPPKTVIEQPKDSKYGDLACNVAMLSAKAAKQSPRELAQKIAEKLISKSPYISKTEIAGPGFLNITFTPDFWQNTVLDISTQGDGYGNTNVGQGKKTLIEYVSANPTGPLHIGHGRGAAVGDTLARLMRAAGFDVSTEYYINDAGRQMRLLGSSVWLRAKELRGENITIPEDGFYKGDYIVEIAKEVLELKPNLLSLSDNEAQDFCYEYAMRTILDGIKKDLQDFRIEHQTWFSEKTLVQNGAVADALDALHKAGHTYEKDDALWFDTSTLGDDKDRVLKKSDGYLTYFASDIAYHHNKFSRGFDYLIDIWGADHHGYVPRMKAAINATGHNAETSFDVILIQLVNLLRNGSAVSMSTRAGTFETLADVVNEVGTDAARFMFLSRKSDSPLDFDLEVVKQRTMDNPVYYVQYAHARICAVLRRAQERGIILPETLTAKDLQPLTTPEDFELLRKAAAFGDMISQAALKLAVHHVSRYLLDISALLHGYYAKHQILQENDAETTIARLSLLKAIGQVIRNGLNILGVSAPEIM